jgi:predicted transcriptional regulator
MAAPVVRLTVNVSPEVAQLLDELADDLMKTNKTQALNQAITTTAALYKAQAAGGQVVVKNGRTERPVNLPTE